MRKSLFVFILLFCSLEGSNVSNKLHSIPSKDQEHIAFLFSHLVQQQNLGFVLFGDTKTAAFCTIPMVCDYAVVPEAFTATPLKYQKNLKLSWAIWNRYRNRFKHPSFIVCEEYDHSKSTAFLQIIFIDKVKLTKLLERYRGDFEEVLGENFSTTKFLQRLERKRKLRPLIKHDEKLLGLILGFGKESSSGFKDMQFGEEVPYFTRAGHKPKGCCIVPVSFRGNPDSPEVKKLIKAYTKEILEIEEIFKSPSFLQTTLEKFCAS